MVFDFGTPISEWVRDDIVTLGPTDRDENRFWSPCDRIDVWWSPWIGVSEESPENTCSRASIHASDAASRWPRSREPDE